MDPRSLAAWAPATPMARFRANLEALRVLTRLAGSAAETDEDRQALRRFCGWGAIPQLFDESKPDWDAAREQIAPIMAPDSDEWTAARAGTLAQFYTDPGVASIIWDALGRLGVMPELGPLRVLESSAGNGLLIATAPPDVSLDWTAVEVDPTSAAICQALHPDVRVLAQGFERTRVPNGHFHLAITNVPFGSERVVDPFHNRDNFSLHNHFIVKNLHLLAPGGLLAVLTSRFTLDSLRPKHRVAMSRLADLVAVIRFPEGMFAQIAGTQAVEDLLIFRRRPDGAPAVDLWQVGDDESPSWLETADLRDGSYYGYGDSTPQVNKAVQRYAQQMVVGEMKSTRDGAPSDPEVKDDDGGGHWRNWGVVVHAEGMDRDALLARARFLLDAQLAKVVEAGLVFDADLDRGDDTFAAGVVGDGRPEGSIHREGKGFVKIRQGMAAAFKAEPAGDAKELGALLDLRDAAKATLVANRNGEGIHAAQAVMTGLYDVYVKRWGAVNRATKVERRKIRYSPEPKPEPQFSPAEMRQINQTAKDAARASGEQYKPKAPKDFPNPEHLSAIAAFKVARTAHEQRWLAALDDGDEQGAAEAQMALTALHIEVLFKVGTADVAMDGARVDVEHVVTWTRPKMGGFRTDPDYPLILALEYYDQDTGVATKAPIFTRRVIGGRAETRTVETIGDALAVVLDLFGQIDPAMIAKELGRDDATAIGGELVEAGLAYLNPASMEWESAANYLSGNVRTKFEQAETAAETDESFVPNVEALRKVLPEWLGPEEIELSLASPWIPSEMLRAWSEDIFSVHAHCERSQLGAVEFKLQWDTVAAKITYGVPGHVRADWIVRQIINGKGIVVYDDVEYIDEHGNTKTRKARHQAATEEAIQKAADLEEHFAEWIWTDPDRAEQLVEIYNRRFRGHVAPAYNGAHLTWPGLADYMELRPNQVDCVWRIIHSGDPVLVAHDVGAGKTLVAGGAAMTARRLGVRRKPMMVVPNHLLTEQAAMIREAWPEAQILVCDPEQFSGKEGRGEFVARCATGDWDLVIITWSAFTLIGMPIEVRRRFEEDLVEELRMIKAETDTQERATVKEVERMIRSALTRIEKLEAEEAKDGGVDFTMLGVDMLIVDEAHQAKRLMTLGNSQGAGGHSQRAMDMLLKVDWLLAQYGTRSSLVMMTGTPISNGLYEMYVLKRYLAYRLLQDLGLAKYDSWCGQFARMVTRVEVAPDGGRFRTKQRFTSYTNVPELMMIYRQFADVVTKEDLVAAGVITLPGVEVQTIGVEACKIQRRGVRELVRRAEAIESGLVKPWEDNMLLVTGDGRKLALDPTLLGMPQSSHKGKVKACARQLGEVYQATKSFRYLDKAGAVHPARGALQVVFCDLGTPNVMIGDQVYGRLRRELLEAGVPLDRIRFVHDAKSAQARSALFADCREGKVSVLVGSTEKMGLGTNVQNRLIAIHHLDAPWRPSDIFQRDGRGDRQGNQNPVLRLYRYVSMGTFDAYMWQGLERKCRFIKQLMSGKELGRVVSELEDEMVLSFAEIKAIATGNPLVLEREEALATTVRLRKRRATHNRDQKALKKQVVDDANLTEKHTRRRREIVTLLESMSGHEFEPSANYSELPGTLSVPRRFKYTMNVPEEGWASTDAWLTDVVRSARNYGRERPHDWYRPLRVGVIGEAEVSLGWSNHYNPTTAAPRWEMTFARGGIEDTAWVTAYAAAMYSNTTRIDQLATKIAEALDHSDQVLRAAERRKHEAMERIGGEFGETAVLEASEKRLAEIEALIEETMKAKVADTMADDDRPDGDLPEPLDVSWLDGIDPAGLAEVEAAAAVIESEPVVDLPDDHPAVQPIPVPYEEPEPEPEPEVVEEPEPEPELVTVPPAPKKPRVEMQPQLLIPGVNWKPPNAAAELANQLTRLAATAAEPPKRRRFGRR